MAPDTKSHVRAAVLRRLLISRLYPSLSLVSGHAPPWRDWLYLVLVHPGVQSMAFRVYHGLNIRNKGGYCSRLSIATDSPSPPRRVWDIYSYVGIYPYIGRIRCSNHKTTARYDLPGSAKCQSRQLVIDCGLLLITRVVLDTGGRCTLVDDRHDCGSLTARGPLRALLLF
jgi:hypothetical protein